MKIINIVRYKSVCFKLLALFGLAFSLFYFSAMYAASSGWTSEIDGPVVTYIADSMLCFSEQDSTSEPEATVILADQEVDSTSIVICDSAETSLSNSVSNGIRELAPTTDSAIVRQALMPNDVHMAGQSAQTTSVPSSALVISCNNYDPSIQKQKPQIDSMGHTVFKTASQQTAHEFLHFQQHCMDLQQRGEQDLLKCELRKLEHKLQCHAWPREKKALRSEIAYIKGVLEDPFTNLFSYIKEQRFAEAELLFSQQRAAWNQQYITERCALEAEYAGFKLSSIAEFKARSQEPHILFYNQKATRFNAKIEKHQAIFNHASQLLSASLDYQRFVAQRREREVQAALAAQQAAKIAEQEAHVAQRQAEYARVLDTVQTQIVSVKGKDLDAIVGEWATQVAGEYGERYQNRIDAAHGGIVSGTDSVLCSQATQMMRECGVNHERFAIRYENEVQQLLHNELITLANNFAPLYEQLQHNESLHALNRLAVKSLDVGRLYNQQGNIAAASKIADFGWATLYFVKEFSIGVGEGAVQGVVNVGTMVLHPIDTVCHAAHGVGNLAKLASNVGFCLARVLALDEEFNIACMTGRTDEFEDEARQMAQRIEYTAGAFKQQCAKLSVRDVGRFVGTFTAEAIVMHKLCGVLSEFYEFTTTHVARVVEEFAKDERVLVETAEGLQLFIADEGVQAARASGMHLQDTQVPGGSGVKGVESVGAVQEILSVERQLVESVRANLASMIEKELPNLRTTFDGIRKGFAEFATKNIKIDYEHILGIETNYSRREVVKLGGFHHDFMEMVEKSGAFKFMNKVVNKNGCYKVDIFQHGTSLPTKSPTFFPSNWSREKVISKIYEAYDNFIATGAVAEIGSDGKYLIKGVTSDGMTIEMSITRNGKMTTAYPKISRV